MSLRLVPQDHVRASQNKLFTQAVFGGRAIFTAQEPRISPA